MRSKYEMKLSKNYTMPIDGFRENGTNSNLLVIGSSGTGKTMNVVFPMLLDDFSKKPVTFIVQDCKGMLYKNLSKKFHNEGYQVKVLDFTNPKQSNTFNPLSYVKNLDDARRISEILLREQVRCARDPFWELAAEELVCGLIMYIKDNFDRKFLNLYTLFCCLNRYASDYNSIKGEKDKSKIIDEDYDKNLKPRCKDENPDKIKTMFYRKIPKLKRKKKKTPSYLIDLESFYGYADGTFNSIIAVAKGALALYAGEEIRYMLIGEDRMNLDAIANKKTIIFVNPSDTSRIYDPMVNLFYTLSLQKVIKSADKTKSGRLRYPFRFIIDDFASGTKIQDFDKLISNIRSRNISCTILLQSISQIESLYGTPIAKTIISNCSTQLYLGSNDFEQELNISKRINMPYEKIHELKRNKILIIGENKKPIIDDKYDYKKHPNYSETGLCNDNNKRDYKDVQVMNNIRRCLDMQSKERSI